MKNNSEKSNFKDNIFSVYNAEKNRLQKEGSDFSLLYNVPNQSLTYKNSNGALTVVFSDEGNYKRENFFFKDANNTEKNKIWDKVFSLEITPNGNTRSFVEDKFYNIPLEFADICETYQFEREKIRNMEVLHKNNQIER